MRTILFACAFVLTLFSFSCGEDTETKSRATGVDTGDTSDIVPVYDCNAMIAHYESLAEGSRIQPKTGFLEFKGLADFMSAHRIPADAVLTIKYGAYDADNARKYVSQFHAGSTEVTEANVTNVVTMVIQVEHEGRSYCYPVGKVCPPPDPCDYRF